MVRVVYCAGAALALGALVGCSQSDPAAPAVTTSVSYSQAPSLVVPGPGTTGDVSKPLTQPPAGNPEPDRSDLRSERVEQWSAYFVPEPNVVQITFTTGDDTCYGSRTVLRESASIVEIAVVTGSLPQASDACAVVAKYAHKRIELSAPVGSRKVLQLSNLEVRK